MSDPLTCPVESAISVIGGKWKSGILFRLVSGPQRLSALRRQMPWISEKVLIRQLKELVDQGVVARRDHGTVPPHVDYRLTPHGQSLQPLLASIGQWGALHRDRKMPAESPMSAITAAKG